MGGTSLRADPARLSSTRLFPILRPAARKPVGSLHSFRCFARERSHIIYGMKTAISLPDELFLSANELAERQGVSRSELYATAVSEYLAKHRDEDVTSKLNEALADDTSGLDPAFRSAQARSVNSSKW